VDTAEQLADVEALNPSGAYGIRRRGVAGEEAAALDPLPSVTSSRLSRGIGPRATGGNGGGGREGRGAGRPTDGRRGGSG
jgi:hypothetical protein